MTHAEIDHNRHKGLAANPASRCDCNEDSHEATKDTKDTKKIREAVKGSCTRNSRYDAEPLTLTTLLDAIVADERKAIRLVREAPELARARVAVERLVKEVPHQLYVGDTALHLAAAALLPPVVEALIDAGAHVNAANRRGAIALHYACDPRPHGKTWNPARQRLVIELLLDAGSDIERQERAGATPLHRAVRARSPEAVRCLLERGARVDATHGRRHTTLLHLATHSSGAGGTKGARAEQQTIVALLREYGADAR